MFKVINPHFLYALILAVILIGVFIYIEYKRKKQMEEYGNVAILKQFMPARSLFRQRLKFVLLILSFIFLVLTLARIQYAGTSIGGSEQKNVEVVAVVDVSNSMLCTDFSPSRLDRAKQILSLMIDKSENAKLGLVEFAGLPAIKLPLTKDYGSAKMFINSMSTEDISTQGTAIGAALIQAKRCFSKDEGVGHSIVLITDAENHEDDAIATAKEIAKLGIQVNVVGLGSPDGTVLEINDTTMKDINGQVVITKLDEKTAKGIAEAGNGEYIHSEATDDIVDQLQTAIDKSADGSTHAVGAESYKDQFEFFAWLSFVFLSLDFLIMERKTHFVDKCIEYLKSLRVKRQKK